MRNLYVVVLAGGVGSRFWPLSRELEPKQFLRFVEDRSLLQQAVGRVTGLIAPENIYVVANEQYKFQIQDQVSEFLIPSGNLIFEPQAKNTAPAIGLTAALIKARDPKAVTIVLPADHYFKNPKKLGAVFKKAAEAALENRLITIGIQPYCPHTGYGYLKIKDRISSRSSHLKVYPVEKFIEKPDQKKAERFFADKRYFWNSGMFVWKAGVILEEIDRYMPQLSGALSLMRSAVIDSGSWARIEPVSIDYGVLEKSSRVSMLCGDGLDWMDMGSWASYCNACQKDADGNVLKGDCLDIGSKGLAVLGKDRLVATIGLKDTIIVDTDDALLVCDKNRSEEVKNLVEHIRKGKRQEHFSHKNVRRPWGSYAVINTGELFKVKLVEINPGKRLSLQKHRHRSEHWVVVEGEAKIVIDRDVCYRGPNQSIYVPKEGVHRIENPTARPLKIVEVQCGTYLEEDDIERFSDDFNRKTIPSTVTV